MTIKKVVAIIASPRKKSTWAVVQQFEDYLKENASVEFEKIFLKDYNIESCRGCFVCLTKGDEFCPIKDDRELLVSKIMQADGLIMATPNYSLQVTAILKNFLDRMAFTFHRPCFFGKRFLGIVTQGAFGGGAILKYFKNVSQFTGFIHVPGIVVNTVIPRTEEELNIADKVIQAGSKRFLKALYGPHFPRPSLFMVIMFRMVRAMYRTTPNDTLKDVHYFRDHGWFTSEYYYPVRLGVLQKGIGALFDNVGKYIALKRKKGIDAINLNRT